MKYFIRNAAGNEYGPFDSAQLASLARSGRLVPTDHVRQDGKSKWYAASTIQGLFINTPDFSALEISGEQNAHQFPVLETESAGLPVSRLRQQRFSRMRWRDSSRFWSIVFSKMLAFYGYTGLIVQLWCWWRAISLVMQASEAQGETVKAIQRAGKEIPLNSMQMIDTAMFLGYLLLLVTLPILVSVGLLWWSEVVEEQIRVTQTRRQGISLSV